jgi:hypothetical protein
VRYSPDELKAIVLHYGSYEIAAKKLGIGKASLVDAANADIKGRAYKLTDKNYDKVNRHLKRLSDKNRKDIRAYEKLLDTISDHPNVKRAFMNAKQRDREWTKNLHTQPKYKRLKEKIFWEKIMSKFYDKYQWKRGHWKR